MTKTLLKAFALGAIASMIFYCGAAFHTTEPDAQANDAGIDAGIDGGAPNGDAGVCSIVCPEPEQTQIVQTFDVNITEDGTAVIPLEDWPDNVIIQAYEYVIQPGFSYWAVASGGVCGAKIYTSPPNYAPHIPVPSIYYHTGFDRWCKVVVMTVDK